MTGFEERCLRCLRCSRSGSFSALSFFTLRFSLGAGASWASATGAASISGSRSLEGMVQDGEAHLGRVVGLRSGGRVGRIFGRAGGSGCVSGQPLGWKDGLVKAVVCAWVPWNKIKG